MLKCAFLRSRQLYFRAPESIITPILRTQVLEMRYLLHHWPALEGGLDLRGAAARFDISFRVRDDKGPRPALEGPIPSRPLYLARSLNLVSTHSSRHCRETLPLSLARNCIPQPAARVPVALHSPPLAPHAHFSSSLFCTRVRTRIPARIRARALVQRVSRL